MQYLPFGELFVNQQNSTYDTRYKFSAKELDNETGYNYFGFRYLDTDLSVWLSVDPMADKFPGLSPYNYCANNPVILVDPNGMEFEDPEDEAKAKASQETAHNRITTLRSEIDDLKAAEKVDKKAIKDKESQIDILNIHIENVQEMIDNKDWKFRYEEVDPSAKYGETKYVDGVVVIHYDANNPDKTAHEETHGHQYITEELRVKDGVDDMRFYDLNDEAKAYQIEYSLRDEKGQEGFRNRLDVPSVKGVNDIVPANLVKSKTIQDNYPYLVSKYLSRQ